MAGSSAKELQRDERNFWESLRKSGDEVDLKYARDLPDDTPRFILRMLVEFEEDVAGFCFDGSSGLVLDAGCGNGNLLVRSLKLPSCRGIRYVGLDFSRNMLSRAAERSESLGQARFAQGCINSLPFKDEAFDRVVSSGVVTCLSTVDEARESLREFHRVLKPGGTLVVDFFNSSSHFTLVRKHLMGEAIRPPEYVTPSAFRSQLEDAGFHVLGYKGFDYKPYQGYLFMSRWRPFLDPGFLQERFSRFVEDVVAPRVPRVSLMGYRIYVKCTKR